MHGRSRTSLLVLALLMLSLLSMSGQSDTDRSAAAGARLAQPAPNSALSLPVVPAPDRDPTLTLPRRLPVTRGPMDFPQIARSAGIIFSGTVRSIARRPATRGQSVETVAITFQVERGIRGAKTGEDLTISQWIGLWASGQRYRVGERVLLFLYPPSKLGLTSCVSAPVGRFSVDVAGRVLFSAQHLAAFRGDPVLGGKLRVSLGDFAQAIQRVGEEE
jgi:hypothetical protein